MKELAWYTWWQWISKASNQEWSEHHVITVYSFSSEEGTFEVWDPLNYTYRVKKKFYIESIFKGQGNLSDSAYLAIQAREEEEERFQLCMEQHWKEDPPQAGLLVIGFHVRKMFPVLVEFYVIGLHCSLISIPEASISNFCWDQKLVRFTTRC